MPSHSEMDRTVVKEIICAVCDKRQEVSNKCVECGTVFGKYYCSKCKFWDDKGLQKKVRTLAPGQECREYTLVELKAVVSKSGTA